MNNKKTLVIAIAVIALVIAMIVFAIIGLFNAPTANESANENPVNTPENNVPIDTTPKDETPDNSTEVTIEDPSTVDPVEDVGADGVVHDEENLAAEIVDGIVGYRNNQVFTLELDKGTYVELGEVSNNRNSLSLKMNFYTDDKAIFDIQFPVGLYLNSTAGGIKVDGHLLSAADGKDYRDVYNEYDRPKLMAIVDRTFDNVLPINDDSPLTWSTDEIAIDFIPKSLTITARAVQLNNNLYINVFKFDIIYDESTNEYYLDNLRLADAVSEGIMSETGRDYVLDLAVKDAQKYFKVKEDDAMYEGWETDAKMYSVVQHLPSTYFAKSINAKGFRCFAATEYPGCVDTFAVTIKIPYMGSCTFYYAIDIQTLGEALRYKDSREDYLAFVMYARDPFNPWSEKTLSVPANW